MSLLKPVQKYLYKFYDGSGQGVLKRKTYSPQVSVTPFTKANLLKASLVLILSTATVAQMVERMSVPR